MIRRALLLLALLLPVPAAAGVCEAAAAAAEQATGLPAGLLAAIGRVEAGRRGADGRVEAWPWSVNAAGQGYFLSSAAEAAALVASLQARGVRSIDVGCFQVNLLFHSDAFASAAAGFDPATNALAAARFLQALHAPGTGWAEVAGRYHSANPALGIPYARQVLASWTGGPAMAAPPLSQVAALVRVFVPGGAVLPVAATTRRPAGTRLPLVITPGGQRL